MRRPIAQQTQPELSSPSLRPVSFRIMPGRLQPFGNTSSMSRRPFSCGPRPQRARRSGSCSSRTSLQPPCSRGCCRALRSTLRTQPSSDLRGYALRYANPLAAPRLRRPTPRAPLQTQLPPYSVSQPQSRPVTPPPLVRRTRLREAAETTRRAPQVRTSASRRSVPRLAARHPSDAASGGREQQFQRHLDPPSRPRQSLGPRSQSQIQLHPRFQPLLRRRCLRLRWPRTLQPPLSWPLCMVWKSIAGPTRE